MTHQTLTAALAAAQGELPAIRKDNVAKIGPGREYRYADLATVLAAVRPVLSKHGLALVQRTDIRDGALVLITELRHASGEVIDTLYPVCAMGARHQDMGGALTYARRYALCALLGIAADDDHDGATAAESPPVRQAKPRADETRPATETHLITLADRISRAVASIEACPTREELDRVWGRTMDLRSQLAADGLTASLAVLSDAFDAAADRTADAVSEREGAFA